MQFEMCVSRRRTAFTLVELLVVIAIIGVLVALLLPAIQAAREASRRATCISQIKQLALGCLNTHDTQKHFPSSGWGWGFVGDPDRGVGQDQPGGWIYNILPFIEQQALHNRGSDGNANVITAGQKSGAADVLQQPISIITCPTRRPAGAWPYDDLRSYYNAEARTPRMAGRSDYAINSGTFFVEWKPGPACPTDYTPAKTYTGWIEEDTNSPLVTTGNRDLLDGISHERSQVTIAQISDGTSNTLMIGEKFVAPRFYQGSSDTTGNESDNETWCTGWNNDNSRGVLGNALTKVRYGGVQDTDGEITFPHNRFGSAHSSVWIAALCDGSARGISFDAEGELLRRLASRLDGESVDFSGL